MKPSRWVQGGVFPCPIPWKSRRSVVPGSWQKSPRWAIFAAVPSLPPEAAAALPAVIGHQPDDPGHGPDLRLTCKVGGKTVTESLPNPAAQRKAEQEIAAFRRWALSGTLIETNETICRARPLGDTLTPQKKTAEAIRQEVER